jgi:branched-chain amino acid transport system substrate-binding protein
VVASVGTYSGVVGLVLRPMLEALQAWTASINARGGLNRHRVRLIVADDGGDPARSKALVQDAVERQRVIAFLQMAQGVSGRGTLDYITAKRIPVIGSDTASPWFHDTSPMYFPQVPSGPAPLVTALASAAAQQLIPEGKVRLATTACVEAQVCGEADQILAREAPAVGFQQVYRGRSSLTQPDFTAECLNARSADAQVFLLVLDINSVSRFAASCARQGYRPVFAILGSNVVGRQADDPNLAGAVAQSTAFPYFQTGTPTTDEYQRVMRLHGAGIEPGVGPPVGWVTAKLFEKAAAGLGEPPTSEAILRGLWSLRQDDLGGLTYPITFVENQPAPVVNCWWNLRIRDGAWTSPDGFRRHCR